MRDKISDQFQGPGDNTSDHDLLQCMTSIGGEYQGRRLHEIVQLREGGFKANVMEGMQLLGDFGYGDTPEIAVRKALLASGCTF